MALLITLVMIAALTGATLALATLASSDIEIAASDRIGTVAFTMSESAVDEVLTDARLALTPAEGGYAPDPGDPVLSANYPPVTTQADATYQAEIQYLRDGPVEESSALQVRSIVYNIDVTGSYVRPGTTDVLGQRAVNAEVYRIAPRSIGVVTRARHHQ
ncbi:hypothetical protein L6R52_03085 [Myxococcota bacterium]|nr:hypothetical protein [Myxococcota bacterium]